MNTIILYQCTIADVLWNGAFIAWIGNLTRWKIDLFVWTDCKLGNFMLNFTTEYSSMLVAVMSIEKFFALYQPLKAKPYCTVETAKWVTSILALVIASLNIPNLFGYKAIGKNCFIMKHRNYIFMLNTLLYVMVPIFTMLLANVAIIYKLMYIKYKGIFSYK